MQMWSMFLSVAEEIRAGNRPQHAAAIAAKRKEIYDWIDQRIEDMFALHKDNSESVEEKKEESEEPAAASYEWNRMSKLSWWLIACALCLIVVYQTPKACKNC